VDVVHGTVSCLQYSVYFLNKNLGNQLPSVNVLSKSNDRCLTAGVPWWVQALQQWEVRQQPISLRWTGKTFPEI
jgi:hypothetical protein